MTYLVKPIILITTLLYSLFIFSSFTQDKLQRKSEDIISYNYLDSLRAFYESGKYEKTDSLINLYLDTLKLNNTSFSKFEELKYLELLLLSSSTKLRLGSINEAKTFLDDSYLLLIKSSINEKNIYLSKIYRNYGNYYFYLGNNDSALFYYNKALYLVEDGITNNHLKNKSFCYQNIGIINAKLKDIESAKYYLKKALILKKELFGDMHPDYAKASLNFGVFLIELENFDEALLYINNAENIYNKIFGLENIFLAQTLFSKGKILYSNWKFEAALLYYLKSLSIFTESNCHNNKMLLPLYLNIGICYEKIKNYDLSLYFYHKSIKKYYPDITKAYRNLAGLYTILGNPDSAYYYYNRALENAIRVNDPKDIALCYNHLGKFYLEENQSTEGKELLLKGYHIIDSIYSKENTTRIYYLYDISNYFYSTGETDSAIHYLDKSLNLITENLKNDNQNNVTFSSFDQQRKFMITGLMALVYFRKFQNEENIEYLKRSFEYSTITIDQIEKDLTKYEKESSFLLTRSDFHNYYNDHINIARSLYKYTGDSAFALKMFRGIEKSKAAYFRNILQTKKAYFKAKIPDSLIRELKRIDILTSEYEYLMYDNNTEEFAEVNSEGRYIDSLFILNEKKERILKHLDDNYELYNKIKYNPTIADPIEIQARLKEDEVLVNYYLNNERVIIVSIDKKRTYVNESKIDSLPDLINEYLNKYALLDVVLSDTLLDSGFLEKGNLLYKLLIEPLNDHIQEKDLIIIPDQELAYLPFEAFIKEYQHKAGKHEDVRYLLHEHAVTYAPSSTLLFNYFRNPDSNNISPHVLAIAPDYSNYWDESSVSTARGLSFKALPGALSEVNRISDYFHLTKHIDDKATESSFKKVAGEYDILHFAMHALIDDDNPLFSKLVFHKNNDQENDGFLNTYEIYHLDLNGDLVVLSSCNTGIGKLHKGEGVINISRAFQFAGIPSTIATLWNVDDKSSSQIMKAFYKQLARGLDKDEALRMAKLDFLSKAEEPYLHPLFWAGYIHIGDNAPVGKTKNMLPGPPVARYAAIGFFILFLIISVYSATRKKIPATRP